MLQKHIEFVNKQIAHYTHQLGTKRGNGHAVYQAVLENFNELLTFLESLSDTSFQVTSNTKPITNKASLAKLPPGFFDNPLALTSQDVEGLPQEVKKELNDLDELEIAILDLVNGAGGILILDKIIAGLYHTTGAAHQRNQLAAKLYRMSKKGLIYSVPKKKGLYTTSKLTDNEGENKKA